MQSEAMSVRTGTVSAPARGCIFTKQNYKNMEVDLYLEKIPEAFQVIRGTEHIRHSIPEEKQYDLFICLDCGDKERLGFSVPLFQNAGTTLCIDHHISNTEFADENYIVPDASSTSELVYRLLDKEKIEETVAEALYMGIVHDTGVFQYSCTSPDTLRAAADLLSRGINAPALIEHTFMKNICTESDFKASAAGKYCVYGWGVYFHFIDESSHAVLWCDCKRAGRNCQPASCDKRSRGRNFYV